MLETEDPPINYHPDHTYTVEQFEEVNDWLKTHSLVIIINEIPVSHFELDLKGRLIPIPHNPIFQEVVISEIARQLLNWNIRTQQNGVVTTSQGGFNLSITGGRTIRAPDVAFTPSKTYRNLTTPQLMTFQGESFHPTFVVEVEDVSATPKLEELTNKFKTEYFAAGVQLGWLVDPVNQDIYVFKKDSHGVVCCLKKRWKNVAGGDLLPDFILKVWKIDEATSQVCFMFFCLVASTVQIL